MTLMPSLGGPRQKLPCILGDLFSAPVFFIWSPGQPRLPARLSRLRGPRVRGARQTLGARRTDFPSQATSHFPATVWLLSWAPPWSPLGGGSGQIHVSSCPHGWLWFLVSRSRGLSSLRETCRLRTEGGWLQSRLPSLRCGGARNLCGCRPREIVGFLRGFVTLLSPVVGLLRSCYHTGLKSGSCASGPGGWSGGCPHLPAWERLTWREARRLCRGS